MAAILNDKQIKALLKSGAPGRYGVGHGLYFRKTDSGSGLWTVRYTIHGKRREMTIGQYPTLTLANATAKAIQIKNDVKEGLDPLAEAKRPDMAKITIVNELFDDWYTNDIEPRLKHPGIPKRVYKKDIAPLIGELALVRVTPMDVRAIIEKVVRSGRKTVANDTLMYCKQLFRHGIRLGLIIHNPAEAFNVHHAGGIEQSRSRALNVEEIAKVFIAFRNHSNQFVRENYLSAAILLVLGVRKGELIGAKWIEFDIDNAIWDMPSERSKTGVAISVPLPDVVIEWLKELHVRASGSEYIFPNRKRDSKRGHISPDTLNAGIAKMFRENKLTVEHFTVHDLRRTCRSLLASLGVSGHVAERCLNHKLKNVEGIYDRYDYLPERKEALQKLADLVAPMINPTPNNVATFRKRA